MYINLQSFYLEILNFPYIKTHHNNYEIYLGNLGLNEKKILGLKAKLFNNINSDNNLNKNYSNLLRGNFIPFFESK